MTNNTDLNVLILRFIFGAILGALLTFVLMIPLIWFNIIIPPKTVVVCIGGAISLIVAICATIWGDKFLVGFMKVFKFFKYFPCF
jgi:hypothetical protein